MPKKKLNADSLLQRIHTNWLSTRRNFREQMILIGSLIHQYLVARLKEGDSLNEQDRIKREISRERIIGKVAERLGVTNKRINEIMCVSLVVNLLSGKERQDLRKLSYGSLRRFRVFIKRANSWRDINRSYSGLKQNKEIVVCSMTEEWAIKKGFENGAKELFKRAVLEEWNDERIRTEIDSFLRNHGKRNRFLAGSPGGKEKNRNKRLDKIVGLLLSFDNPASILQELKRRIENPDANTDVDIDDLEMTVSERNERNNRINAYQALAEQRKPLTIK